MAIEWSEDLSTGDEEIDSEHKEIFRRVNMLLAACDRGRGRSEIGSLIGFLDDYISTHFSAEEQIMSAVGYAEYGEHKAEHEMFSRKIDEIRREFMEKGGGLSVVLLTVRTSVDWLTGHIRKTDKKLGIAIKASRTGGRRQWNYTGTIN